MLLSPTLLRMAMLLFDVCRSHCRLRLESLRTSSRIIFRSSLATRVFVMKPCETLESNILPFRRFGTFNGKSRMKSFATLRYSTVQCRLRKPDLMQLISWPTLPRKRMQRQLCSPRVLAIPGTFAAEILEKLTWWITEASNACSDQEIGSFKTIITGRAEIEYKRLRKEADVQFSRKLAEDKSILQKEPKQMPARRLFRTKNNNSLFFLQSKGLKPNKVDKTDKRGMQIPINPLEKNYVKRFGPDTMISDWDCKSPVAAKLYAIGVVDVHAKKSSSSPKPSHANPAARPSLRGRSTINMKSSKSSVRSKSGSRKPFESSVLSKASE